MIDALDGHATSLVLYMASLVALLISVVGEMPAEGGLRDQPG
jgi:hypothetical protein